MHTDPRLSLGQIGKQLTVLDTDKLNETYGIITCTRSDIDDIMDTMSVFMDTKALWPENPTTDIKPLSKKIYWAMENRNKRLVVTGRMEELQVKFKALKMQRDSSVNTASTASSSGGDHYTRPPSKRTQSRNIKQKGGRNRRY